MSIQTYCDQRFNNGRQCTGCKFKGAKCDRTKKAYKVKHPYEIYDRKEIKILKRRGFDSYEEF